MKKLLILLAVAALAGCSSPQKKAESAVKEFIKTNIDNPRSYKPIAFEEIEGVYYYEYTDVYDAICGARNEYLVELLRLDYDDPRREEVHEAFDSLSRILLDDKNHNLWIKDSTLTGWTLQHSWQITDEDGESETFENEFYISSDFSEVSY